MLSEAVEGMVKKYVAYFCLCEFEQKIVYLRVFCSYSLVHFNSHICMPDLLINYYSLITNFLALFDGYLGPAKNNALVPKIKVTKFQKVNSIGPILIKLLKSLFMN